MKKGFTLIELLAVIVILAIIALIATPIVLNIINDTKESAIKQSADFYVDALELSISTAILKNKTIKDGVYNIIDGDMCLNEGCTEKLEVEVNGEVPKTGEVTITKGQIEDITLNLSEKTVTKNENGQFVIGDNSVPEPKSFREDSWETIAANVKAGNLSKYKVGDTKEIALTGFTNEEEGSNGLYTVRIANTSTPSECNTSGFSQTACGFVIEFEDIIIKGKMNETNTNVGGWEASLMRSYVNSTIYESLPKELKAVIIPTTVVSSHGSTSGETNFESTDKLYLLSTAEVRAQGDAYDTARDVTRQLDYYKNYENEDGSIGVTTTNYSGAIKNLNGTAKSWWVRSAASNTTYSFYNVHVTGDWRHTGAINTRGVAVAFRL